MEGNSYIVYYKQRSLSPSSEQFLNLLRQWRDGEKKDERKR